MEPPFEEYDDPNISFVEDLDPEPEPTGKFFHAREIILGLALLVAVLVWAGSQTLQQARLQNEYSLAQQAEASKDWDQAYTHYLAASDYKDAKSRAGNASKLIAQRDKQYHAIVDHASKGDWAAALQAAQSAQQVQPDYKNLSTLAQSAEEHVYQQALSGTIALRAGAQPPGLYYRTADNWIYLQNSDVASRVRSNSAGCIAYDVSTGGRFAAPGSRGRGSVFQYGNRRLMLASFGGPQSAFRLLAFFPTPDSYYECGEQGIWQVSFRQGAAPGDMPILQGYAYSDLSYQPYDSPIASQVALPSDQSTVMALSSDGAHILLADWKGAALSQDNGRTSAEGSGVRLYLANADGSKPRLLYTQTGGIQSAEFSPDKHSALLETYASSANKGAGSSTEEQSVILLDLQGNRQPVTLSQAATNLPAPSDAPRTLASATFLARGGSRGKILLLEHQGAVTTTLSLLDPRSGDVGQVWKLSVPPLGDGDADDSTYTQSAVIYEEPGGAALDVALWSGIPTGQYGDTMLMHIEPGKPPVYSRVPWSYSKDGRVTSYGTYVNDLWVRDGTLLYGVQSITSESSTYHLYSTPLAGLGSYQIKPTEVYSSNVRLYDRDNDGDERPMAAIGSGLLAYSAAGTLSVRSYDGSIDLPLETGVAVLYDLGRYGEMHWLAWSATGQVLRVPGT